MNNAIRKLAVAVAASLAFAAPTASAARGDTFVFNHSDLPIHPYFQFHCPGTGSTGWLNFGGIGPNGFFGWGPLVFDGCAIEFTYTVVGGPAPTDPVKGNLRSRVNYDPDGLHIFVIATDVVARELEGPGETGR